MAGERGGGGREEKQRATVMTYMGVGEVCKVCCTYLDDARIKNQL